VKPHRNEVQDCRDPRRHQAVGEALRRLHRHGQHHELDAFAREHALQVADVVDGHLVRPHDPVAHRLVEGARHAKSLAREAAVGQQRRAQVADADQGHGDFAVRAQDALQIPAQVGNVVAEPRHAELAEVRQVLPYLRGVQAQLLREVRGADLVDLVAFQELQDAGIQGQALDHGGRNPPVAQGIAPDVVVLAVGTGVSPRRHGTPTFRDCENRHKPRFPRKAKRHKTRVNRFA